MTKDGTHMDGGGGDVGDGGSGGGGEGRGGDGDGRGGDAAGEYVVVGHTPAMFEAPANQMRYMERELEPKVFRTTQ